MAGDVLQGLNVLFQLWLHYASSRMWVYTGEGGGGMLASGLDEQFTAFYHAAYADGEIDNKTKVLIGLAVSATVGCYP
jgi:alkylhydroperoxidase/carboxymuconolactone decarboxylase family protein YurZ